MTFKSSMSDIEQVAIDLFDRVRAIASHLNSGDWDQQPQHVRDEIIILFAMARNRMAATRAGAPPST